MKAKTSKKRILIAGMTPYSQSLGKLLVKEGYEIVITRDLEETRIEWLTGHFQAGIMIESGHLGAVLALPSFIPSLGSRRPILYHQNSSSTIIQHNNEPAFPIEPDARPLMILAILRSLLRRINGYPTQVRFNNFGIDITNRKASYDGQPLSLPDKQFDLLTAFVLTKGNLITQTELHQRLWPHHVFDRNRLAAQIVLLRKYFKRKRIPIVIRNRKGSGYIMQPLLRPQSTLLKKRTRYTKTTEIHHSDCCLPVIYGEL